MCAVRKVRSGAGAVKSDLGDDAGFDPPQVDIPAIDDDVIGGEGIPW